jgi:hypothetical protein
MNRNRNSIGEKVENNEMIPLKFYLSQNYPNPFKEKTKIKYCVPFKTRIIITVFNSKRDFLKKILDKEQAAGTFEVEFDRGNLPEGIYFYRLQTETLTLNTEKSFSETKEMVLVKGKT